MSSSQHQNDAMADTGDRSEFGRIFVVLDVTSDHTPAMESAASLAARLEVPLVALFVEHGQLEQLEQHPLVRAIDLPTGMGRSIEIGSMRRSWKALARRMQRRLARLSRRYRLEASFETVHGDIRHQLEERTGETDLLVVESAGRNVTRHVRIGSRGHAMARRMPAPVVFVGARPRRVQSVAAVYDGSDEARRGIDTALQLATKPPALLTLLLVADTPGEAENLHEEVMTQIQKRRARVRPHARRITCCDTDEIVQVADHVHANFVVVPGNEDYPDDTDIDQLTRRLDCPVLVLRGE